MIRIETNRLNKPRAVSLSGRNENFIEHIQSEYITKPEDIKRISLWIVRVKENLHGYLSFRHVGVERPS